MNANQSELTLKQEFGCGDHVLIVAIVESDFAQTALKAAKAKGADRYTVIHGRGKHVGNKESIFGVSLDLSRDLVLAVVHKDKAFAVQDSIFEAAGLKTDSHGLVYQLPVTALAAVGCGWDAQPGMAQAPPGGRDKGDNG